jgi:DNA-binding response OmpR family regulator
MLPDRKSAGSVLIVEDSECIRELLSRVLLDGGFEVAAVGTGGQALELTASRRFDVLVVDLGLPDIAGEDLILSLRKAGNRSRIAVLSGQADSLDEGEYRKLGVDRILPKPIGIQRILGELRELVAAGRSAAEEVRQ